MAVVFIVLIALAITSAVMGWLDASEAVRKLGRKLSRQKIEAPDSNKALTEAENPALQDQSGPTGPSGEIIAAITVALAMARRSTGSRISAAPAPVSPGIGAGQSAWAASGRRRAMDRAPRTGR